MMLGVNPQLLALRLNKMTADTIVGDARGVAISPRHLHLLDRHEEFVTSWRQRKSEKNGDCKLY